MPKTTWSEVSTHPAAWHLLIGRLDGSFAGGPQASDPFDTARVRFAVNLMARYCSGLQLRGPVALQGGRDEHSTLVRLATSDNGDFRLLSLAVESTPALPGDWKGQGGFVLDDVLHHRLLTVAGAPDARGAGRRARERHATEVEDRSLRWRVSSRAPH